MKTHVGIIMAFTLVLVGAGCTDDRQCYQHEEDGTYVIFQNESPAPSTIIYDEDGSNPLETYGYTFNETEFRYADGSGFYFQDGYAIGHGGTIDGMELRSVSCPSF